MFQAYDADNIHSVVEDVAFESSFPNLPDGVLECLGLLDDSPR